MGSLDWLETHCRNAGLEDVADGLAPGFRNYEVVLDAGAAGVDLQ